VLINTYLISSIFQKISGRMFLETSLFKISSFSVNPVLSFRGERAKKPITVGGQEKTLKPNKSQVTSICG